MLPIKMATHLKKTKISSRSLQPSPLETARRHKLYLSSNNVIFVRHVRLLLICAIGVILLSSSNGEEVNHIHGEAFADFINVSPEILKKLKEISGGEKVSKINRALYKSYWDMNVLVLDVTFHTKGANETEAMIHHSYLIVRDLNPESSDSGIYTATAGWNRDSFFLVQESESKDIREALTKGYKKRDRDINPTNN